MTRLHKSFVILANALWISAALSANRIMPTDGARNLVRTMKLGEVAILAAQVGLTNNSGPEEKNLPLLNCVRKIKVDSLVDDLAPEIDAALTPMEIQQAAQFFSSAVGQTLIDLGLRDLHRRINMQPESPVPRTRDEAREIDAFSKTSAGEKLLVKEVMSRPGVGEKARSHMREIVKECLEGDGRTR
jgi:hypothetical protein